MTGASIVGLPVARGRRPSSRPRLRSGWLKRVDLPRRRSPRSRSTARRSIRPLAVCRPASLVEDARVGRGAAPRLRNSVPGLRRRAGRARPTPASRDSSSCGRVDRGGHPGHDRVAVLGVADRVAQHVLQLAASRGRAAASASRRRRPGRRRRAARFPGSSSMPELAEALDRRRGRRRALRAEHERLAAVGAPEDDRHIAARAVQVRLDDLQRRTQSATAASNALPPRSSTAIPAAEASQWVDATMPNVPRSSGRVVNVMRSPAACERRPAPSAIRGASRPGPAEVARDQVPVPLDVDAAAAPRRSSAARTRLERAAGAEAATRRRARSDWDVAREHDPSARSLHHRVGRSSAADSNACV